MDMKAIFRPFMLGLLSATSFFAPLRSHGQEECSTEFGTAQETQLFIQRHQDFLLNEALYRSSNLGTYKWIPVFFHILRASDGSGGISLSDARSALVRCNNAYAPTFIRFFECGYQYHDNDTYYDEFDKETEQVGMVNAYNIDSVANVYIVDDLESGSGGFAKFPDVFETGLTVNNYMVIDRTNMESPEYTTLQHEFGHFFDLPHTHAWGDELVNGSNCTTAGDGFCDTPADPTLECGILGNVSCGIFVDDCDYCGSDTDANGDLYAPSTTNIMSYSCKECRTNWSPLQATKMNFTVSPDGAATRNHLNCTNCSTSLATLPPGFTGAYILGEHYHHNEIVSSADLTNATIVTSDILTLIATDRIRLLPGFDFSANDPDLHRFRGIIDPCGFDNP